MTMSQTLSSPFNHSVLGRIVDLSVWVAGSLAVNRTTEFIWPSQSVLKPRMKMGCGRIMHFPSPLLDSSSDFPSPFLGRTRTSGSWVVDMSSCPDSYCLCLCVGQPPPHQGEWLQCSCDHLAVPTAHRYLILVQSREVFICSSPQPPRSIHQESGHFGHTTVPSSYSLLLPLT